VDPSPEYPFKGTSEQIASLSVLSSFAGLKSYVLIGHNKHADIFVPSAYEQGLHALHSGPPFTPAYPTTQMHVFSSVDPVPAVIVFGGHDSHWEDALPPRASRKVFPPQSSHM